MNSIEKVLAFKRALVATEEEFEGLLGAVQGIVSFEELKGGSMIEAELGNDPARVDEELTNVAGFVLWLRSDDAPPIDVEELAHRMPAEIAELARAVGIG